MTLSVTHAKVSAVADDAAAAAAGEVLPSDWNAGHTLSGSASVAQGGTGSSSLTAHAVLLGNGTGALGLATIGTAGRVLIDQGSGADPAFTAISGDISLTSAGVAAVNALHSGAFANPSASIGLTANNGSATTAMRSDATPALSQAISPTWTGNHTHNPTSGNAITVSTVATSIAQAFNTTQTPGAVTNNAATNLNLFQVNTDDVNAGANFVNGWTFVHNLGNAGNALGGRQAMEVELSFNAATNSSNTNRNYVAITALASAQASDGGGVGTEKGMLFAFNPYVQLKSSATNWVSATGAEFNTDIQTGTTVLDKYGLSVVQVSTDKVAGSRNDSALVFVNQSGAVGWGTLIQIGDNLSTAPLKTTGKILALKGAQTIDSGIDLTNATITTAAFKSTGFNVNGSGVITGIGGVLNNNATAPPSGLGPVLQIATTDAISPRIEMDGYAAAAVINYRRGNNTAASPSALAANDVIGTFGFAGYNGSAWVSSNRAIIAGSAAEAWTTTANGTYLSFYTTANTTTTVQENMRFHNSGGLTIGNGILTTDPGSGALIASASIKSNGASSGIGYATGAGGTVTQATSKTTGVTLNKVTGQITMNNASLANAAAAVFTLTNSTIAATDTVVASMSSGTTGAYNLDVIAVAAGSCQIQLRNVSGGALTDAVVINFTVIKGVTS